MLTSSQIAWASKHDWFASYDAATGLISVYECYLTLDTLNERVIEWRDSFAELRNWAGY